MAVVKVLAAPEKRELVLVRATSLIRAEHCTVAALVAHAIDVDDLRLAHAGHMDGDVCTVRADFAARLADGRAAEAARRCH